MRVRFALVTLFVLICPPIGAQSPSTEALSREIADLKRQVAALEQRLDLVISMLNRQPTPGSSVGPVGQSNPVTQTSPAVRSSVAASPPRSPGGATRVQCQATTKKGTQCSRMAQAGASYCWQHAR